MPQELVLMKHVDTDEPVYMHSVDAAEAARLGDYVYADAKDVSPEDRQMARARTQGMTGPVHMELLSPEERQRVREEANEQSRQMAEALRQPSLMPQETSRQPQRASRSAQREIASDTTSTSAQRETASHATSTSARHAAAREDDKK